MPPLSVVMAVHDDAPYLRRAIDSILAQTFRAFELVIVDDGSSDGSGEILRSYGDPRMRLIEAPHGGTVAALNRGIAESRAPLIARMDGDDISHPERLERQVAFLARHPAVGMVGCWTRRFDDADPAFRELLRYPLTDLDLRAELYHRNPFMHGALVYRRAVLARSGLYREASFPAEDYDLWFRISEVARVANLPDILYRYRRSASQVSATREADVYRRVELCKRWALQRCLDGIDELGHALDLRASRDFLLRSLQRYAQAALKAGDRRQALALTGRALALSPAGATSLWAGAVVHNGAYRLHRLSTHRRRRGALAATANGE